jgi:hypothetical protein
MMHDSINYFESEIDGTPNAEDYKYPVFEKKYPEVLGESEYVVITIEFYFFHGCCCDYINRSSLDIDWIPLNVLLFIIIQHADDFLH